MQFTPTQQSDIGGDAAVLLPSTWESHRIQLLASTESRPFSCQPFQHRVGHWQPSRLYHTNQRYFMSSSVSSPKSPAGVHKSFGSKSGERIISQRKQKEAQPLPSTPLGFSSREISALAEGLRRIPRESMKISLFCGSRTSPGVRNGPFLDAQFNQPSNLLLLPNW